MRAEEGKMYFCRAKWPVTLKIAALAILFLPLERMSSTSPRPSEPVTLVLLFNDWEIPDRMPGSDQPLEEFTRETGIKVKLLAPPEGSLNALALWKELLQKGSTTPDLYGIDLIWAQILSSYFLDLKSYFGSDLSSAGPLLLSSYSDGDRLVAMPFQTNIGVLLYRTDLLRKYGYKAPPKTWDELEKMAARIQAGERQAGKKDFWGYVWQGAAAEGLTCNALEWQVSEGGGHIIEPNATVSVNNPNTIRSWKRAARWVGAISPPGVVAYREWDSLNVWGSGNSAFHRTWESHERLAHLTGMPVGDTVIGNLMEGKVGVTSLPTGSAGGASTLGGSGLAVSRFSAHPQETLQLIRYLLRARAKSLQAQYENKSDVQLEFSNLPPVLSLDPRLRSSSQRWDGIVTRPTIVAGMKYEDVTRAYINAVHSVLTHQQGAAEAAASLEKQLIQMTGFKKGPPLTENHEAGKRNP